MLKCAVTRANTLEVAEKCSFKFEFGKLRFPVYNPPDGRWLSVGPARQIGVNVALSGNRALVVGGINNGDPYNAVSTVVV